jgi:hypothetical protein
MAAPKKIDYGTRPKFVTKTLIDGSDQYHPNALKFTSDGLTHGDFVRFALPSGVPESTYWNCEYLRIEDGTTHEDLYVSLPYDKTLTDNKNFPLLTKHGKIYHSNMEFRGPAQQTSASERYGTTIVFTLSTWYAYLGYDDDMGLYYLGYLGPFPNQLGARGQVLSTDKDTGVFDWVEPSPPVRQPTFHFAADQAAATAMENTKGQAGQVGENVADGDMIIVKSPLQIFEVTP